MADGEWQMANDEWQMADGRWQMANRSFGWIASTYSDALMPRRFADSLIR
jgi:hypothetical protein